MPFKFLPLETPGLMFIKPRFFSDDRGFFKAGIGEHLVQGNYSRSTKETLSGLHYQRNPKAQGKIVSCVKGRIYDVAVDIRKGSPYYKKWSGIELTEENKYLLYVPTGYAHGFQVISDTAEVMYKCTEEYSPENDRGIIWNDPDINVAWPLKNPLLSEKDKIHPLLTDADNNFEANGQV